MSSSSGNGAYSTTNGNESRSSGKGGDGFFRDRGDGGGGCGSSRGIGGG